MRFSLRNWSKKLMSACLPSARSRRPARLAVEPLDDRIVPALGVANNTNAAALVAQILGTNVAVSNIQFSGFAGTATVKAQSVTAPNGSSSAGTFTGGGGIIGFDTGIVLSTGGVYNAPGPNVYDSATPNNAQITSQTNNLPGDANATTLAGSATLDATILEFDFVPDFSAISFQYVFASEEYNEYANGGFNDVFGFFLNGVNIARLPSTTTASSVVSINNVNATQNSTFYRNNGVAVGKPINVEMDGLTSVLAAVGAVNPGVTNHIKLVIADVGDRLADSNVFIKSGSFGSNTGPTIAADNSPLVVNEGQTAARNGSYVDPNNLQTVTMTASVGTITKTGTSSGTWAWSFNTNDGPVQSQTVTITADDGNGGVTTFDFPLVVNNVNPVVTGLEISPASLLEGQSAVVSGTFTDPGVNDSHTVTIDWRDGSTPTSISLAAGVLSFTSPVHAFLDNISLPVLVTVTDKDNGAGTATVAATVGNVAPSVAAAGSSVTVTEGSTATNTGTWSDPGVNDAVVLTASIGTVTKNADGTWTWSLGTTDGPSQSQTVTITATDKDTAATAATFALTVNNATPSVAAAGGVTVTEGSTAANTGTWSDPGVNDAVVLTASVGTVTKNADGTWTWSLGTVDGPGQSQTVTITATDKDGASSAVTFALTVNNAAPSVSAGASGVTVTEGSTAANTGTWSDPGVNDAVTLSASIGAVTKNLDGTWSWSFATNDGPGQSQTVTITATDKDGAATSATFALTVNNATPVVAAAAGSVTVTEGSTAANNGTWSDPGVNDAVALTASIGAVTKNADGTWSWSLGTVDGPGQSQSVTITATDKDGAASATTFALTVNNAAPVVAAAGNVSVTEGATAANTGTWSDLGVNDAVALSASIGAVTKNANGTWSWSFATNDGPGQSQTVTITATDKDGAATATTFALSVSNAVPVASLSGPAASVYGQTPTFTLGAADASSVDQAAGFTFAVNWNDGSPVQGVTGLSGSAVSHTFANAGTFVVSVTATDKDSGLSETATWTVVVATATLTVTAGDAARVYGAANPALGGTLTGLQNGDIITASYATAAGVASPVGTYPITATLSDPGNRLGNYTVVNTPGTLTVSKASTATAVGASNVNLLYGVDGTTLTATVGVVAPGTGTPTGTVSFYDGATLLGTAAVSGGSAALALGPTALAAGAHAIIAVYTGDGNFLGSASGSASVVVTAPSLIHGLVYVDTNDNGLVDFGEQAVPNAAVTLTGTNDLGQAVSVTTHTDVNGVYSFTNLRPSNPAGYTVTETQPGGLLDGKDTLGTIGGIAVGTAGNDTFTGVVIGAGGTTAENYNFGERPANTGGVAAGQTASIGFWQNKNGQDLIKSLNGGATSTQLGNWLAASFPNMYGAVAGKTNAQVGAFYKTLFSRNANTSPGGPPKTDAQVMATALAVYVTNQSLAGSAGTAYGFMVTATGVGTATFNVGSNGAAFGVANNTSVSVMQLLLEVNARSHNGLLYDTNANGSIGGSEVSLRVMANDVFSAINELGHF